MTTDKRGRAIAGKLIHNLEASILRRKPDLMILDPFVKTHSVEENVNSLIDDVAQLLTDLAVKHNIAIDVPHHTSKGAADPGNADRGRGASALKDAARLTFTLSPMSADEAEKFNIKEEDRYLYIRLDRTPPTRAKPKPARSSKHGSRTKCLCASRMRTR